MLSRLFLARTLLLSTLLVVMVCRIILLFDYYYFFFIYFFFLLLLLLFYWLSLLVGAQGDFLVEAIKTINKKFPDAAGNLFPPIHQSINLILNPLLIIIIIIAVLGVSAYEQKKKVTVNALVPASLIAKGLKANEWASATAVVVGGKGGGKVIILLIIILSFFIFVIFYYYFFYHYFYSLIIIFFLFIYAHLLLLIIILFLFYSSSCSNNHFLIIGRDCPRSRSGCRQGWWCCGGCWEVREECVEAVIILSFSPFCKLPPSTCIKSVTLTYTYHLLIIILILSLLWREWKNGIRISKVTLFYINTYVNSFIHSLSPFVLPTFVILSLLLWYSLIIIISCVGWGWRIPSEYGGLVGTLPTHLMSLLMILSFVLLSSPCTYDFNNH